MLEVEIIITNQISHVTRSHHRVVRLHVLLQCPQILEVDHFEDTHSVILSLCTEIGS